MATILIPGRHVITSAFMVRYLTDLLEQGLASTEVIGELNGDRIDRVLVPVTSANQSGSRYNPVPLHARVIGLERTLQPFRDKYGIQITYVPIPHFRNTDKFAELTVKYINAHTTEPVSRSINLLLKIPHR